jgi:penicillin-binding protein 2
LRIKVLFTLFGIAWLALLVRVFYLAIQHNSYYDELSEKNSIKLELIAPVRGEIIDRNNNPIAINKLGFKIQIAPHLSHQNEMQLDNELNLLLKYIPSLDRAKMKKIYVQNDSFYNQEFIQVADFVPYDEMIPVYSVLNLREKLRILPAPKRYYPYGETAAHIIGYVSNANQNDIDKDPLLSVVGYVGKNGIEKYYNSYLEGEAGERKIKVNATNEQIQEISNKAPVENKQLKLTIDMNLQKYITDEFNDESGAVIVMDVNGSILAAGSFPEYDLNVFSNGISVDMWKELIESVNKPFTNKLVNGLYPPGSIVKVGLGLLLVTTKIDEYWRVNCTGNYVVSHRNFRCWKKDGHGDTDLRKAIRESCDDFFYKGSVLAGIDAISEGMKRYGFGRKTEVDLPNEFVGTVPDKAWKRKKYRQSWYIGDTLNTAIGQGNFLVTPMQAAKFTALIATGREVIPHFADQFGSKKVVPNFRDILSSNEKIKIHAIREGMYDACNAPGGTATQFLHSKIKIAGKTGTAQVVGISQTTIKRLQEEQMGYYSRSHAWLTTYGPYENPQYIVTVLVEHGGHGGHAAGDIVSNIYDRLLSDGYIKQNTAQ